MQAPAQPRYRKRIPCQVRMGGKRHSGMVLNLSRGGLFVQTSAGGEPGAGLEVELNLGVHAPAIALGAQVVWSRVVAPHLRSVSRGGLGVRIQAAPEPFYALLGGLGPAAEPEPATAPEPRVEATPAIHFCVRVQQRGGPRSRSLRVSGASPDEASRRALAEVGDGWSVLEVQREGRGAP